MSYQVKWNQLVKNKLVLIVMIKTFIYFFIYFCVLRFLCASLYTSNVLGLEPFHFNFFLFLIKNDCGKPSWEKKSDWFHSKAHLQARYWWLTQYSLSHFLRTTSPHVCRNLPVKCVSNIKLNLNKMQPQQKNMAYPELINNPQTFLQSSKNLTCYAQCTFLLHQCFPTCNKNSLKNVVWQDVIKTKCKINCIREAITQSPSFNSILETTKSDAWQGPR